MTEANVTGKRRRRTNAEILADSKKERTKKKPARVRRTNAQIAADEAAEAARREQLAVERAAHIPTPKPIKFDETIHFLVDGVTAFGRVFYKGEEVRIVEGTREYSLAFNIYGEFIFGKTPEEQIARWGVQRYGKGSWPYGGYEIPDTVDTFVDDVKTVVELTNDEKMALESANRQRNLIAPTV